MEDTISILRGLKERYEVFHGVKIQDSALIAAATLSNRYISDRFLPDKAIDLVDEACAMIRTEMDSMPAELDDLRRKIMQHEIEEAALKKETDTLSAQRLAALQKELAEMREQFKACLLYTSSSFRAASSSGACRSSALYSACSCRSRNSSGRVAPVAKYVFCASRSARADVSFLSLIHI